MLLLVFPVYGWCLCFTFFVFIGAYVPQLGRQGFLFPADCGTGIIDSVISRLHCFQVAEMWWPAVESDGDKAARVEAGLAQLRGCSSVSKAAVLLRDVLEEYCTAHAE